MMKIGLRIPGVVAKQPLDEFAAWCKSEGFDAIDLGHADAERGAAVRSAGLVIGTIDFWGTSSLLSSDEGERKKGIDTGVSAMNAIADAGGDKAFCVFFPQDANQSRRNSFENWKLSFPVIAKEAERRGVRIAMEGWPGPNNSALGVTPETLRAMLAAVPSENFGINYDPSHLVRIGVDYKRFLNEFSHKVIHAHGKDTSLDTDALYHYGTIGPSFDTSPNFGEGHWRYCIPGEGTVDWAYVCSRLHRAGFDGVISIELEDFRYNGTEEGEKRGLTRARAHLLPYL